MEPSATTEMLMSLYEWWKNAGGPFPATFAPDFVCDDGLQVFPEEDWLWWVRQNPGWGEPELLGIVGAPDGGAIVFSAIDPVTLLKHRISWLVELQDKAVRRILVTTAVVSGEMDRNPQ